MPETMEDLVRRIVREEIARAAMPNYFRPPAVDVFHVAQPQQCPGCRGACNNVACPLMPKITCSTGFATCSA